MTTILTPGGEFGSMTAAAAHHGISVTTVMRSISSNKLDWANIVVSADGLFEVGERLRLEVMTPNGPKWRVVGFLSFEGSPLVVIDDDGLLLYLHHGQKLERIPT